MRAGYLEYPRWLTPVVSPDVPLRWYGVLFALAVVVSWFVFRQLAQQKKMIAPTPAGRDLQARFFTYVLVGALVGARLAYVLSQENWQNYLFTPWRLVWPFEEGVFTGIQGFNELGAIAGASLGTGLFSAVTRERLMPWMDALAVTAPLFTVSARLGNFANGEFLGRITTVPWAVQFPSAERLPVAEQQILRVLDALRMQVESGQLLVNLPRHPVQLYEALFSGIILWLVVWFTFRQATIFPGAASGLVLSGHGAMSFVLGYYREADQLFRWSASAGDPRFVDTVLVITPHQLASLGITIVGIVVYVGARVLHSPPPTVATYEEVHTE